MSRILKKVITLAFPIIVGLPNYVFAYTMPVGIPTTTIDFEQAAPERPSNWTSEVPGYYYIDAVNGASSGTYGSESKPIKSLPRTIPAGSYIEIAGELKISGGYVVKANGTSDAWVANSSGPVWITTSEANKGTVIGGRLILTGSNVFLTNLNFKEKGKPQVGSPTAGYTIENIVVRNNDINGSNFAGTGLAIDRATNAIIYNNKIHDFGDINTTLDEDAHVINIGASNNNIWVLSNEQHTASGAGLQVIGDSDTTSNIFVGNNEVYNVRQSGIWLKGGKNVVFSSNHVHDIIDTPWSVSKGMGAQYAPDSLWMINNHIEGAEYGIRIASTNTTEFTKKIYSIGNIINNITEKSGVGYVGTVNSWQSAGIHLAGGEEHYIYNNLIFDAPNGVITSSYKHKVFIKNNIIFDLNENHENGNRGYSIWSEGNKGSDKLLIENNFFNSELNVKLNHTIYETAPLLSVDGYLKNIVGDIEITDSDIDSITSVLLTTPTLSDSLKDSGTNINNILITAYKEAFPNTEGVNLDFLGDPRSLGHSIDIGPLEQDGIKPEYIIPNQPSNIKLNILD